MVRGAINRSFISVHFLLSTYFVTAQTYKRMCLHCVMKHYRAKPSAQLAVMNWSNHKNVHCMRLHNARAICQLDNHMLISCHDLKLDINESAKSHQA